MIPTFVTIVYIAACIFMVLVILIQQKGGGLGSLGGAASQSVFGGGGGTDILARLTTICASIFMIGAMYLAYVSAHSGSDFLKQKSAETEPQDAPGEVNWERIGPNAQNLPTADQAKAMRDAAAARLGGVLEGDADPAGSALLSSPADLGGEAAPEVEGALSNEPSAPAPSSDTGDGSGAGADEPAPAAESAP